MPPSASSSASSPQIYCTHERMLAEAGARDAGDLVVDALSLAPRAARAWRGASTTC